MHDVEQSNKVNFMDDDQSELNFITNMQKSENKLLETILTLYWKLSA